MKPIGESSDVFMAYSRIDFCYYGINEIYQEICKPRSPIEKMIDNVTGFADEKYKEQKEATIEMLKEIISSKKIVEADYSSDEELLNKILSLSKNSHP